MKKLLITILILTLFGYNTQAQTAVVNNPSDISYVPGTLRYEINNAVAGTTIYLTGLTSSVNLQDAIILTKDVKLVGTKDVTTIDGNLLTNLFEINPGVTLEMDGLILQEGSNLYIMQNPVNGQAVIVNGHLVATNCTFKDNEGFLGGAIYCSNYGSTVTLTDCVIKNNKGRNGGAIHINNSSVFTAQGCTFQDNQSNEAGSSGGHGGAIWINNSKIYILNCSFTGNRAIGTTSFVASGGAISARGSLTFKIANSSFYGNTCNAGLGGTGGAMSFSILGFPVNDVAFNNLTISNNSATHGGGICINSDKKFDIGNCIVAKNHSSPGIDPDLYLISPASLPVSKGGNLLGVAPAAFTPSFQDLVGSMASPVDPQFIQVGSFPPSSNGDYHLMACSPAMNTGNSTALPLDVNDYFGAGSTTPLFRDLDGNNRIINLLDKGCYEHLNASPGSFYYTDGNTHCKDKGLSYPNTGGLTGTFTSSPAGLSINPSTGVVTRKFSAVGVYTITFYTTSCTGTPISNSITYTINPNPIVSITETINPGFPYNTTSLNAVVTGTTGAHTYRWYRYGNYIGSSSQITNPCSNATYEVYVTNTATGCVGYASYAFNNSNNPICIATPPLGTRMETSCTNESENLTSSRKSMETSELSKNWKLFPNPSDGETFIELDQVYSTIEFTLTDLSGKHISTGSVFDSNRLMIETHQPGGTYFVHILADGISKVYRLVLR